jgi:hypothetical protein
MIEFTGELKQSYRYAKQQKTRELPPFLFNICFDVCLSLYSLLLQRPMLQCLFGKAYFPCGHAAHLISTAGARAFALL